MLIGMYHNRLDPNKVSRAYLYQAIAKVEDVEFFYFISSGVNFESKTIKGKYYKDGNWINKVFPFPDVIINAANPRTKEQEKIKNKLKTLVPFTSQPVGSKVFVYDKIIKGEVYKDNIIPYKQIESLNDVFNFLNNYSKVIIKPIRGHHGDNVLFIERVGENFLVREKKKEMKATRNNLEYFLESRLSGKLMLVQKYINSRLKNNNPFDFRVHMQKDGKGEWNITLIIPRVGSSSRIITNISQGSQMAEFDMFLYNEFSNPVTLKKKLETFAMEFTKHFESLYDYKFDELGIDIGLDEFQNIWIYEVNYRPGHVFIEVITARNAIGYAKYLAKLNKGEIK